jgi:hypothetical protein
MAAEKDRYAPVKDAGAGRDQATQTPVGGEAAHGEPMRPTGHPRATPRWSNDPSYTAQADSATAQVKANWEEQKQAAAAEKSDAQQEAEPQTYAQMKAEQATNAVAENDAGAGKTYASIAEWEADQAGPQKTNERER